MDTTQPKTVHQKDLSQRVEEYLLKNYKAVIGVFVVTVLLIAAYAITQTVSTKREKAAQEELFVLTSAVEKKQTELSEAAQKTAATDSKNKKADPLEELKEPEKTSETLSRDFGPQIKKLEDFVKANEDRKAGLLGAMALSDIYLEYGEPKKAADVLKSMSEKPDSDDLFYGLINSQYALALSNSNNCQDAVGVYDRILKHKEHKHIHAQAMLRKGVCLMTLNKNDEAKNVFQEARTEFPDSVSGRSAESFERYLALKKGQAK